jgi:hypothetical protein
MTPSQNIERLSLAGALLLLLAVHLLTYQPTEPFFNNDETRHLLTGVYFRDLFHERPIGDLVGWTVRYYLQYPATGLLVWPPFFYAFTGLLMSVFGTSIVVGKIAVGLFAALACVYLYVFVRFTHDWPRALGALLIFGLAPMSFKYSRQVMLEMPTLALALASTFHFWRYLEKDQRRDIFLAAGAAALSALTRFDAVYLLPLFGLLLALKSRWDILRRYEVWLAALFALFLLAPAYAATAKYVGWLHFQQASQAELYGNPATFAPARWAYYLIALPQNFLGWFLLLPALAGLAWSWRTRERTAAAPYLAIVGVVYLTFTLISELDQRHAIYWLPAWAFFTAQALWLAAQRLKQPRIYAPALAILPALTLWAGLPAARLYVRGYAEAAGYITANAGDAPFCFFSGRLNGNFIYQLRRQDTPRRLWTLRADKLLFNGLISSRLESRALAEEQQILDTIYRYDPTLLVLEEPAQGEPFPEMGWQRSAAESRIREIIANHKERFRLEKEVAVDSNMPGFAGLKLRIYRNLQRNPNPTRNLQMENLMLRDSLQTEVK